MATTVSVRDGLDGNVFVYQKVNVTISSNTGSETVTFDVAFGFAPAVAVVTPRGAAGTYSATSVTTTGFTISVTGETDTDFDDNTVPVYVFAHNR